jgi:hypothetical protein
MSIYLFHFTMYFLVVASSYQPTRQAWYILKRGGYYFAPHI